MALPHYFKIEVFKIDSHNDCKIIYKNPFFRNQRLEIGIFMLSRRSPEASNVRKLREYHQIQKKNYYGKALLGRET